MNCDECGDASAQPVEATFADGRVEEIELCLECLEQYREGKFVSEVMTLEED